MNPVFIVGCGHSGTSLLANMFAAHPDVYIPLRETEAFLTPSLVRERVKKMLDEFSASGRLYLVEKTPRHIHVLPAIRQTMPGARFVIMARDGRDVAASFIKRYGTAQHGIKRWIKDNAVAVMELKSIDCVLLRYEDLIADTTASLQRICSFCGIPFHEAMLRYHEQERLWFGELEVKRGTGADGAEHRALRNWQINQPIFDGRGKWHGQLSQTDLDSIMEGTGGALMTTLGYR